MSAHSSGKITRRAKKWVDPLSVRGAITAIKRAARAVEPEDRPKARGRRFSHGSANARGELTPAEPHPAAYEAKAWIAKQPPEELLKWREAFASCAIEGNRLGEVCAETLNRLMSSQPVSDRYLLGLAWTMRSGNWPNAAAEARRTGGVDCK